MKIRPSCGDEGISVSVHEAAVPATDITMKNVTLPGGRLQVGRDSVEPSAFVGPAVESRREALPSDGGERARQLVVPQARGQVCW